MVSLEAQASKEQGFDDKASPAAGYEVWVGGLPQDATAEAVTQAFASVGVVLSARCVCQKLDCALVKRRHTAVPAGL